MSIGYRISIRFRYKSPDTANRYRRLLSRYYLSIRIKIGIEIESRYDFDFLLFFFYQEGGRQYTFPLFRMPPPTADRPSPHCSPPATPHTTQYAPPPHKLAANHTGLQNEHSEFFRVGPYRGVNNVHTSTEFVVSLRGVGVLTQSPRPKSKAYTGEKLVDPLRPRTLPAEGEGLKF